MMKILLVAAALVGSAGPFPDALTTRSPAVAGQFYPSDPGRLKAAIQAFLKDAQPPRTERPIAIVVPHAGYLFSGQIAADAYRQIQGQEYDIVVILGTNHTVQGFDRISVFPKGSYRTPLGDAPVDEAAAAALLKQCKDCDATPADHTREHSIEVQVPFVQVLQPKAKILPVMIGEPDLDRCARLGHALAHVVKGHRALIIASSDLSHYPAHSDAVRADHQTLTAIARLNARALHEKTADLMRRNTPNLATCACGEAPVLAALTAAADLGAARGTVISYANSGDGAVADRSRVVGYGAVVLSAGARGADVSALRVSEAGPDTAGALQRSDKLALLRLARETVQRYLSTGTVPLPRGLGHRLDCARGAFVTLKKHGQLRGCIGRIPPEMPLAQTVSAMAAQAAFNDQRFQPLVPSELPEVEFEISVLTPMKRIAGPEEIKPGRDGVVIEKGGKSAVFLPQVAREQNWSREEMLDQLCRKAGLPERSWRSGARFMVFQAEVFSESELR